MPWLDADGRDDTSDGRAEDKTARFRVALQRSRMWIYALATLTAVAGKISGTVEVSYAAGLPLIAAGWASALLATWLIRTGRDARLPFSLEWGWMLFDTGIVTWGVYLTGGAQGPWFIWYLANTSGASFVGGLGAAAVLAGINTAAYLGILTYMGEITGVRDDTFWLALCQKLFLYAAAMFFLRGVARLQESQRQLRQLREDEGLKIEELTRLTQDLDQGTRALAEANVQIREADRVKSQFLANMSHELRTPLNSIIGFSEILMERLSGLSPKHMKFLANINSSGQHLLSIINDILDLSKVEAGHMEIHPEEFRVGAAVDGVLAVMHGMSSTHRITFEVDVPRDLPQINTDPAKFKQILYNLLSNAVKFSPEGSLVKVVARHEEAARSAIGKDAISVSVLDQGMGVAPADRDLIFEEFRQADGSASRAHGGTGLGLALVKKFALLQGGAVGVESEVGRGSTFTVTLPLVPAPPALASQEQTTAPDLPGSHRVLVVEDDILAYQSIARALIDGGYFPIRARLGEEALQMARLLRPTAITLDLQLPDVSGWEVLKALKRDPETMNTPVVIVSMLDNRELGLTLGAEDYFVKPVDRERLLERLNEIVPRPATLVGGRLLLIDDDPSLHEMMEDELSAAGYAVEHAYSGQDGIDRALARTPDAVILDLMMPDLTGFEVADLLQEREETAHVPIVVLTAKDLTPAERRHLQGKIAAFVRKGHGTPARLVAAIRDLERRHPREAARAL